MTTSDSWESYFYPETYQARNGSGTLRNLYGERDDAALHSKEYLATHRRSIELSLDSASVPRTYDAAHVSAIHGYLFQDVYEWAGEFRTVNMVKFWPPALGSGQTRFLSVDRISSYLDDVQTVVRETAWPELDLDGFAHAAADVFSRVNFAHPAREGNGRATKMFLQHVAELSKFEINYDPGRSGVTPEIWNLASTLTSPNLGSAVPDADAMVPVFHRLAQPRTSPLRTLDIEGERARAAKQAPPRATLQDRLDKAEREIRKRNGGAMLDSPPRRGPRL